MAICVVGTGYVGLVTGTVFADLGYTVRCADKDREKIKCLKSGIMPIYEPGLEEMVKRNTRDGRLTFTTDIGEAIRNSDIIFIAVGTPPKEDGDADVTAVDEVALMVARNLYSPKTVVNKSTVPVGTADRVRSLIEQNRVRPDVSFEVLSNPEFLREGNAIADTLKPDRVIIGASSPEAAEPLKEIYAPLGCPILVTDVRSAELIKYASNAFLATKISYINALANICELIGADVTQVAKGIGMDSRIGPAFLNAGLGWGGSCFGKDIACLLVTSARLGYDFELLRQVVQINDQQPTRFLARVSTVLGSLQDKTIAVLGLAFKPNTDDLRDGKSLEIIAGLQASGAQVRAYDPIAIENARKIAPDICYCDSAYSAAENADAIVIVTEWSEFKHLDMGRLRRIMRNPIIFDGRNMFDPETMKLKGMRYYCVGRPAPD